MEVTAPEFYEGEAEIYDEVRYTSPVGKLIDIMQKAIVLKLCDFNDKNFVLDVGTGTGRFAIKLAKNGATVIGLDPSKSMVDLAKKKSVREKVYGNMHLIVADAHRLPFKKDCFNCCISINVLNHIPDYNKVLVEIASVLEGKGYFLANFPNMQSFYLPVALFVNFRKRALFSNVYSQWFTFGEIKKSLFKAELRAENIAGSLVLTFPPFLKDIPHVILHIIMKMNALFSCSILKYFSGSLFIKSQKVVEE